MFVLVNPHRSEDDITHQGTAPAQGPEAVVRHVVAGGDVDLPELVAVPGQAVAGVVRQTGAGPEVELVDVGTVPGEHQESVVTHSLEHRGGNSNTNLGQSSAISAVMDFLQSAVCTSAVSPRQRITIKNQPDIH